MKTKGSIKVFRKELEWLAELTDSQTRLYYVFRHAADWDKNHETTFGTTDITLKEIKKYLPWSIGKISQVRKGLINIGLIIKTHGRYAVNNFEILNRSFHEAEAEIQSSEKNLLIAERHVQKTEKVFLKPEIPVQINEEFQIQNPERNNENVAAIMADIRSRFRRDEPPLPPKET